MVIATSLVLFSIYIGIGIPLWILILYGINFSSSTTESVLTDITDITDSMNVTTSGILTTTVSSTLSTISSTVIDIGDVAGDVIDDSDMKRVVTELCIVCGITGLLISWCSVLNSLGMYIL